MRKALKWLGFGLGGIMALALVGYGVLYTMSTLRIRQQHHVPSVTLHVPTDSAAVARGRHIVQAITKCGGCHGDDLAGGVMADDRVFGRLSAPNLTPAGIGAQYSDADWVRAIRHGVNRQDRSLRVMPSYEFNHLTDADLGAIVAYLKTLPLVEREIPTFRVGPLGHFLVVSNKFPVLAAEAIDHFAARAPDPEIAETAEYGRYLANLGCIGCHGPQLRGGQAPATGPDITPRGRVAGWTREDFMIALRAGVRPDRTVIDTEMPWTLTGRMTDLELGALWAYLQELSPQVASRGATQ